MACDIIVDIFCNWCDFIRLFISMVFLGNVSKNCLVNYGAWVEVVVPSKNRQTWKSTMQQVSSPLLKTSGALLRPPQIVIYLFWVSWDNLHLVVSGFTDILQLTLWSDYVHGLGIWQYLYEASTEYSWAKFNCGGKHILPWNGRGDGGSSIFNIKNNIGAMAILFLLFVLI